jgi:hypothetical protein
VSGIVFHIVKKLPADKERPLLNACRAPGKAAA